MARSTTAKTPESTKATLENVVDQVAQDMAGTDVSALMAQLKQVQVDILRIAETLAALGHSKGEAVAATLRDGAEKLYGIGEGTIEDMTAKAEDTRAEVEQYVRRKPVAALGIAAGLGLLFGLLLGRK